MVTNWVSGVDLFYTFLDGLANGFGFILGAVIFLRLLALYVVR